MDNNEDNPNDNNDENNYNVADTGNRNRLDRDQEELLAGLNVLRRLMREVERSMREFYELVREYVELPPDQFDRGGGGGAGRGFGLARVTRRREPGA